MKLRAILLARLIPLLVGAGIPTANAQTNAAERTWLFRLLDGSYLVDDCLICGPPTFQQPMRGGFTLALTEDIPPFVRYEIRDISFVAGMPSTSGRVANSGCRPRKASTTHNWA